MPLDVVALAQAGATALVGAMATDTWTQLRTRVARLLGRDDAAEQQAALDQLDDTRAAVDSAKDKEQAREAEAELRALLKARLRSDPTLAAQFAVLVEEVRAQLAGPAPTTVSQRARADRGATVIQSGRDSIIGAVPSVNRPTSPTTHPPGRDSDGTSYRTDHPRHTH
jgi:hypothetical protein